ncbi:MAG: collagen-like protein [Opitutaceae bacterium]|nr:collagen-like protein [Opitutaceae bacterium]
MAVFLKRRLFRVYLGLRARADAAATRAFVCVARMATGISISTADVRASMYLGRRRSPALHITGKKVTSEAVSMAVDQFEESRTRISTVAAKVSTLLTVTSIAVSGTLTSLSLLGFPSNAFFYGAFLLTITVFLCTGWFLFKFLGVGRSAAPALDQEFLDLQSGKKKAAYIRNLLSAAEQNDARTDFLVDIYKAGRRMSVLSFCCALVLLTLAVSDRLGREDRLILKLRADQELVELLRGPRGQAGPSGQAGKSGPKGDAGRRGPAYVPSLDLRLFEENPFKTPRRLELVIPARDSGPSEGEPKANEQRK